jgi:hypothetical protein
MVLLVDGNADAERVAVWQCIGCGKIDGPRPCVGVCEDRKVEIVYAYAYDEALAQLASVRRRAEALEAVVRQLARTTPRAGEWERSYQALQGQARRALAGLAADAGEDTGKP